MAATHAKHHDYHLVNPSPWPLTASISAAFMAVGLVIWMRSMNGGAGLFGLMRALGGAGGLAIIDTVRNKRQDLHLSRLGEAVTWSRDAAQQTIYFKNTRVEPSAEYTYDAVYRLIEATGREHLGQAGGRPLSRQSRKFRFPAK